MRDHELCNRTFSDFGGIIEQSSEVDIEIVSVPGQHLVVVEGREDLGGLLVDNLGSLAWNFEDQEARGDVDASGVVQRKDVGGEVRVSDGVDDGLRVRGRGVVDIQPRLVVGLQEQPENFISRR